jgi:hypothetical protein
MDKHDWEGALTEAYERATHYLKGLPERPVGPRATPAELRHEQRDPLDFNPEFSRRARGFPVYAAIRALGRSGIAEIVERCHAMARRFADTLAANGVAVLRCLAVAQRLR